MSRLDLQITISSAMYVFTFLRDQTGHKLPKKERRIGNNRDEKRARSAHVCGNFEGAFPQRGKAPARYSVPAHTSGWSQSGQAEWQTTPVGLHLALTHGRAGDCASFEGSAGDQVDRGCGKSLIHLGPPPLLHRPQRWWAWLEWLAGWLATTITALKWHCPSTFGMELPMGPRAAPISTAWPCQPAMTTPPPPPPPPPLPGPTSKSAREQGGVWPSRSGCALLEPLICEP